MSNFVFKVDTLKAIEDKVSMAIGIEKMHEYASVEMGHSLLCGCGAGGNCSSSCVSGCAERG